MPKHSVSPQPTRSTLDDLGQQTLAVTRAHPHRDQQVVLAGGILGEAGGPLRGGKARGEVVGREDSDGPA